MYAPAGGETISRSMCGWLKTGSANVCKKIAHSPRKLLIEKNCSQNLLTMSKFFVSKNLLNKFAHGES
jgi:adenosylmethionine-8-amino-7-oxononanoate aminotransferase